MDMTREEIDILESIEKGEWQSMPNIDKEIHRYAKYAEATLRKDKRINIRISERDLMRIQQKALEEGMPYQTLISSILHKYVSGRLVDTPA